MRNAALTALLSSIALLRGTAGQDAGSGVLLSDGTLNGTALQIPASGGVELRPENLTYSRTGCYDGAAELNIYFGLLAFPVVGSSVDTSQSHAAYGVHTWTTTFRHSNASSELYELNDDIYWDLESGNLVVIDPRLLLNTTTAKAASDTIKGVADYDSAEANNTITPAAIVSTGLNTAVVNYGPAGTQGQNFQGITLYPPPNTLEQEHPPQTYRQYLQRVLYMLESITLSRNAHCAFDNEGRPDLIPLTSYALDAVLAGAEEGVHGSLADYSLIDGQPVDLDFVVGNDMVPSSVCMVKNNAAVISQGGKVYAITGDVIGEPFEAEDQEQCCSACARQGTEAVTSTSPDKQLCNFWLFCHANEPCRFPNGNGTLSKNECALGYSPQLAINETIGHPIEDFTSSQLGNIKVAITWPNTGLMLPQRADSQTATYGLDMPAEADASATQHVQFDGALQFY